MFTAAHQSQVSPPGLDHEAPQAVRVQKWHGIPCHPTTCVLPQWTARHVKLFGTRRVCRDASKLLPTMSTGVMTFELLIRSTTFADLIDVEKTAGVAGGGTPA